MMMRHKQAGFTLIELVVVIIILVILASVAMPKLLDLDTDAKKAATKGASGALMSSAQISYGKNQGAVTLASIRANTVIEDPLVSFAPSACNSNGTDTLFSATYNNVFQFNFSMDHTLCSG